MATAEAFTERCGVRLLMFKILRSITQTGVLYLFFVRPLGSC
jgi:hypothetical protein